LFAIRRVGKGALLRAVPSVPSMIDSLEV
jgi:hypothetical protein